MDSIDDMQREFYEIGYAGAVARPSEIIAELQRLPADTRVRRAAAMMEGMSGHLLDVGCGSGPLLYLLREQFCQLTGVDIADAQLSRVKVWSDATRHSVQLHRCNLDLECLPVADASVDVAACMVVLEFVFRPDVVLKEIARVLRPGGVFVGSVGNIVSWKNRLRVLAGQDPNTTSFMNAINGGALHHFTQKTFIHAVETSGFVVEQVGCSGRAWQMKQHWPALLGGDILVRARKRSGQ